MEKLMEYKKVLAMDPNRQPPIFNSIKDKKRIIRKDSQIKLFYVESTGAYRINVVGAKDDDIFSEIVASGTVLIF
jgi:hypothetical protein